MLILIIFYLDIKNLIARINIFHIYEILNNAISCKDLYYDLIPRNYSSIGEARIFFSIYIL